MSRTKKGKKGTGHEYWGKRPGPRDPGKISKKITHKIEREENKKSAKDQLVLTRNCDFCQKYTEVMNIANTHFLACIDCAIKGDM